MDSDYPQTHMRYFEIQSQRILPQISLIHMDFKNQFAKIRGIRGGVLAFFPGIDKRKRCE